jgi:ATP/maltotriose-dependent transcriptional regulator MalT
VSQWLKGDFLPYTHPSFLENYANRVKAQYHYQTRQYSVLLAFINSELEKNTILYGKIELLTLKALLNYKFHRHNEAIAALTEAYDLSESNRIIVSFIQYGKDMRALTAAALRDSSCTIPQSWLKNINRKASAFAKRQTNIVSAYKHANRQKIEISLTQREVEILNDLAHGLSRAEIAASHNISVNTVKMTINNIYEKLHASNLADAIRIAADRKII